MNAPTLQFLADLVLLLHFAVVLFVVLGLPLVWLGAARTEWLGWDWHWVRARWFRLAHLAAIGVVVAQAWLGQVCPLTTLESWLRVQAGGSGYNASFIETWVSRLIFYQAPGWVFTLAYTLFGAAVAHAWWRWPPR
jgi:hypothetical protein